MRACSASISVSEDVVWKELRRLGFRYLSARPRHHAQDPQASDDFKKSFGQRLAEFRARLEPGRALEIWFQDEMRVGQKNKLTYRWAKATSISILVALGVRRDGQKVLLAIRNMGGESEAAPQKREMEK